MCSVVCMPRQLAVLDALSDSPFNYDLVLLDGR